MEIDRHKTAITRYDLSRPVKIALEYDLLNDNTDFFDYGCGKGNDVEQLKELKIKSNGWDPKFYPQNAKNPADIVNIGYVVNVIEDYQERCDAIKNAWSYTKKALIVAARLKLEMKSGSFKEYEDGHLTSYNTFQKFYEQDELNQWIDNTLGADSVAVAPGIFLVFKNEEEKQNFLLNRIKKRIIQPKIRKSDVLYEKYKIILQEIIDFFILRGRIPIEEELQNSSEIVEIFGSIKRAFNVIRNVTGSDEWERIEKQRRDDMLVFLALERFRGRPRMSALPEVMQRDVKAMFGAYSKACDMADKLLFSLGNQELIDKACQEASYGKLTFEALYVVKNYLHTLTPILRVYEGCASRYVGDTKDANLIKLNRRKPKISYLSYPDFEKDPHPPLQSALAVSLGKLKIRHFDYSGSDNPFILHRKETFIPKDNPLWGKFNKLTIQEEKMNLYEDSQTIGTRDGWKAVLESKGVSIKGHRVVKINSK